MTPPPAKSAGSTDSLLITLSALTLVVMMSAPFLLSRHVPPLPSFESEWWAATLGVVAFALAFSGRQVVLALPRIALLPLLLILAIAVQWAAGIILVPTAALLEVLYLLWAAGMMLLGAQMNLRLGSATLATALAWGLLFGATASAGICLLQYFQILSPYPLVLPSFGGRAYGNLAQSNHAAGQIWLGIVAAIYLNRSGRLRLGLFLPLMALLMLAAAATESRSPLLYSVLVALLLVLNGASRRRAALIPLAQCLAIWLAPRLLLLKSSGIAASAVAVVDGGTLTRMGQVGVDPRWELWSDAWRLFLDHPWLGIGSGNYVQAVVDLAASKLSGYPIPAEHAHNLTFHWLAEFGLPVTLLALGLLLSLLLYLIPRLRDRTRPEAFMTIAVLGVLGLYSQFEYPLWYTYFLGPAALFAGALDGRCVRITFPEQRALMLGLVLVGTISLFSLKIGEGRLQTEATRRYIDPLDAETFAAKLKSHQHGFSLLTPYADLGLVLSVTPSPTVAAAHWRLCQSVLNFAASAVVMERCSLSARLDGQIDAAAALDKKRQKAWAGSGYRISNAH